MTQVAEITEGRQAHLDSFARWRRSSGDGDTTAWLDELRHAGIARFEAVGFPSTKEEEWRFTNVAPIARIPFDLADRTVGETARRAARQYSFGRDAAAELVFVNGHYAPELSRIDRLPRGVHAGSLAAAMRTDADRVQQHLAKVASVDLTPFVALNTGFLHDGAYIHIGRGFSVQGPIHLIFVSAAGDGQTVSHPRVLVIADDSAEAAIVESYVGAADGVYFTNGVAEIVAADNARIDHTRLQQESHAAFHISAMQVLLGRQATLVSQAATLGGRLTRNDLVVVMNGQYAEATLNGLVILGDQQHCDNHTLLRHEKPNCPSHELYKHVLDGRSTGVFKGKIFVQKDAQKTDSKQTSKSLLLSDEAMMESMPALEIYADDVKCTHGSTTGPVDEDMVFYLRTRGIGLDAARHLLTYAFAADITRRIRVDPVRQRLEDYLAAQHGLPQDLKITDEGSHDEAAL